MRTLPLFAAIFVIACQSGVTLSVDGDLQYPCTRENDDLPRRGTCPGELFCGADSLCHTRTTGAAYACNDDLDCAGTFRCGPKNVCLDPSGDALRTDSPVVTLTPGRLVGPKTPWHAPTALAAAPTFFNHFYGPLSDVTPIAVAQNDTVFSVMISRQGFTLNERVFVGAAKLPSTVREVAVARQQVFAITDGGTYHYVVPVTIDGGVAPLSAGPAVVSAGERLRTGGTAYPLVAEFSRDAGTLRLWDTAQPFNAAGQIQNLFVPLDDVADNDGAYLYAAMQGRLYAADKSDNFFDPEAVDFRTVSLVSPGRNELLTDCGGSTQGQNETLYFRSIHVASNPDLLQPERPLIAFQVEAVHPDGGHGAPRWLRADPDPLSNFLFNQCGTGLLRHVVRGNCFICDDDETLVDLQWGSDAVLRAQCKSPTNELVFYDLGTDETGFACTRTRRFGVGYGQKVATLRSHTSASAEAVAVGDTVYLRRSGVETYTPLTLDRAPIFAQEFGDRLVVLGARTMYRETEQLGLTLSSFGDATDAFPTWVTGGWLLYDDGRVGDAANLGLPQGQGVLRAAPSRRDLAGPIAGTSAKGSNGRDYLVMTAFDALLGADLTQGTGPLPSVDVKAVPEPQVEILSVATVPGVADGGSLFTGFVLTENRVFALDALTEQRWELAPITVPDGEWRKVWVDGRAGRLGYDDGVVYSLPSGVPIARALGSVTDYLQFCQRTWALTADALYRLDTDGGTVGTWADQLIARPPNQKWSRMYANNAGELWLFSQEGFGVGLKGSSCP